LYALKGDRASVEDVWIEGLYFKNLDRVLRYAAEGGIEKRLEFDAARFLSDGPGPFGDFKSDERLGNPDARFVFADFADATGFTVDFIAKVRGGKGAINFQCPSGAMPSEDGVLSTGSCVRSYDAFIKQYNESHNVGPMLASLRGKLLE